MWNLPDLQRRSPIRKLKQNRRFKAGAFLIVHGDTVVPGHFTSVQSSRRTSSFKKQVQSLTTSTPPSFLITTSPLTTSTTRRERKLQPRVTPHQLATTSFLNPDETTYSLPTSDNGRCADSQGSSRGGDTSGSSSSGSSSGKIHRVEMEPPSAPEVMPTNDTEQELLQHEASEAMEAEIDWDLQERLSLLLSFEGDFTPEDYELLLALDDTIDKKHHTVESTAGFEKMTGLMRPEGAAAGTTTCKSATVISNQQQQREEEEKHHRETYECRVCLECVEEKDVCLKLPCCERVFHNSCIEKWLTQYRNSCPNCRFVF